jgi:hypothetical protein
MSKKLLTLICSYDKLTKLSQKAEGQKAGRNCRLTKDESHDNLSFLSEKQTGKIEKIDS